MSTGAFDAPTERSRSMPKRTGAFDAPTERGRTGQ